MRNYFINLINYDKYANEIITKLIIENAKSEKSVQLMAHILAAQKVWYQRCNLLPPFSGVVWPDWQAATFTQMINDNHKEWIAFVTQLNEADFEKRIAYQNSKGDAFNDKLVDILGHLINHGTHHRAQIGQHLKLAGLESLPVLDYIGFVRNSTNG
ncbi:putative damage-inducible protein DinB [Mucilaginibacter frigoritolerans]|uniref:Putative damage-inducible protein DinB n=1 Tax=Mucilaginibacter frigoritolerans TaxID=652788 RepID=A0A562TX98_9SPHI|nr:DinB family protein [Mucilaginibacter frigoritolerans]TWI98232.1 putative damage-inducible protein DinB [Mucilaginibacter frigoritolerans]